MFTQEWNKKIIILLIYVDERLTNSNDDQVIIELKGYFSSNFHFKDLN